VSAIVDVDHEAKCHLQRVGAIIVVTYREVSHLLNQKRSAG
jgi:hypothetical protein